MVPKSTADVEELAVPVKTIARSVVLLVVSAVTVVKVAVAPLLAVTETVANTSAVPVPPIAPKVTSP